MDIAKLAETTGDMLTVKRVYGEAYERDGVTVIPAATVRGGAGGGGGKQGRKEGDEQDQEGEGEGGGFTALAKPAGAFVISGSTVRWVPALDVNRLVVAGQLVGLALILLVRLLIKQQARVLTARP